MEYDTCNKDEIFEYDSDRGRRLFEELENNLVEQGRHTTGKNSDVFHLIQYLEDKGEQY